MPEDCIAAIFRFSGVQPPFVLQHQYVCLNGLRFYLYYQDSQNHNPERYPRWFELFTAYCHEMAHLFVTYLGMTYGGKAKISTPKKCTFQKKERPEAGDHLEHYLFGGRVLSRSDESGRDSAFEAGLPTMDIKGATTTGPRGISLGGIIRLAEKPVGELYQQSELQIQTFPPKDNFSPNNVRYGKWWQDFRDEFGRNFANRTEDDARRDSLIVLPDLLTTAMRVPSRQVSLLGNP